MCLLDKDDKLIQCLDHCDNQVCTLEKVSKKILFQMIKDCNASRKVETHSKIIISDLMYINVIFIPPENVLKVDMIF